MSLARRVASAAAAVAAAGALLATPAGADVLPSGAPAVRGDAATVVDARTGEVLLADAADERHAIASATKLMTALLALERAEPGDVFTAPAYRPMSPIESMIRLRAGERMKVEDLLRAIMLESANDAAVTLAEGVSGSREAFVAEMNDRAAQLRLANTSYANPIGLDDPENYSSAEDLAALARRLLRDRLFARIADSPSTVLRSGARTRRIANRNLLVRRHPFVSGVKTGHTREAGFVLVGSAERGGAEVVSVVLGEPSESARDADTLALLRWGLDQFRRAQPLVAGRTVERRAVKGHDRQAVRLVPARTVALTVRKGSAARVRVRAPEAVEGPLDARARVGTADVVYRGKVVERVPLLTASAVPAPPDEEGSNFGWPLAALASLVLAAALLVGALRWRGIRRGRVTQR